MRTLPYQIMCKEFADFFIPLYAPKVFQFGLIAQIPGVLLTSVHRIFLFPASSVPF